MEEWHQLKSAAANFRIEEVHGSLFFSVHPIAVATVLSEWQVSGNYSIYLAKYPQATNRDLVGVVKYIHTSLRSLLEC